jgi:hypothetical protein
MGLMGRTFNDEEEFFEGIVEVLRRITHDELEADTLIWQAGDYVE